MIQIQWTAPHIEEGRRIIKMLLEECLVACATIVPAVESHYRWEGKLEISTEVKVYLKTEASCFSKVEQAIRSHCSYKVPEIIAFEVCAASEPYEAWVKSSV